MPLYVKNYRRLWYLQWKIQEGYPDILFEEYHNIRVCHVPTRAQVKF